MSDTQVKLGNKIVAYYDFIDGARKVISSKTAGSSLSAAVKERIEIPRTDKSGPADLKFESAIHSDIEKIEKLLPYLQGFEPELLNNFQNMVNIEIGGLEGDLSPKERLLGTKLGAIFTAVSVALIWFGFWANFYNPQFARELFDALKEAMVGVAVIEAILIIVIFLGGTFGIISYVYQSWRGRRQASLLRTISRAITLYLIEIGTESASN